MGRTYTSDKKLYWLIWDGSISSNGQLHTTAALAGTGAPLSRKKEKSNQDKQRKALKKRIKLNFTGKNPLRIPLHISVRIKKVDVQGGLAYIPVQLKNPDQVRALLLRIYDKANNPLYQEYIDLPNGADDLLRELDGTEAGAVSGPPLNPAPAIPVNPVHQANFATTGHSLCRVEVWASRNPAVLKNKQITDKLEKSFNVYMVTVGNEYEPTPKDVQSKRKGYGESKGVWAQTAQAVGGLLSIKSQYLDQQQSIDTWEQSSQLKRSTKKLAGKYQPRVVSVANGKPCLRIVMDRRSTSNNQNFNVDDRINDIEAQIREAESALAAEPVHTTPDAEIRIFVAPEWYFRKSNNSNKDTNAGTPSYDHAEFLDIVKKCKALSAKFPEWLIVPGTIYWTLGYAKPLHQWDAGDLASLQNDVQAYYAVPMPAGNDGVPRAAVVNGKTFFNGNLALFLNNGQVIHYMYKEYAGEAEWPGHEYLTSLYLKQEFHFDVFRPSYFLFRNVLFGVDICRDHYEHRCFYERSGQLAAIRTSYLQNFGAAKTDVDNAVAGVANPPLLALYRGYVTTILSVKQGSSIPAKALNEQTLDNLGYTPVVPVVAWTFTQRATNLETLIAALRHDVATYPEIRYQSGLANLVPEYENNIQPMVAGAPKETAFDQLVARFVEQLCGPLKSHEDKAAAAGGHVVTAQNLMNNEMTPFLLTGPQVLNGTGHIAGMAARMDPQGNLAGDLDAMLIVSNGTPNRQYGALDVAVSGIVAQCDGAKSDDCAAEQIQTVANVGGAPRTRAQCASDMAAGGQALARYDIISTMFDLVRSKKQEHLDAGQTAQADLLFKFERDFLGPLFVQLSAGRSQLTQLLDAHAGRATKITVPGKAQSSVDSSYRFDDANVDTLLPPTGRGGSLTGRIL